MAFSFFHIFDYNFFHELRFVRGSKENIDFHGQKSAVFYFFSP